MLNFEKLNLDNGTLPTQAFEELIHRVNRQEIAFWIY